MKRALSWTQGLTVPKSKDVKYRLSQSMLRALTADQRPAVDAQDKTFLEPNAGRKAYRFPDGAQGALRGFWRRDHVDSDRALLIRY
ncbi:hypothetical protein FHW69_001731 [Luteibacter sp. Sphag1AF]|nr:hypothetical protein [Luteibacter sp. Sphag1AF]